MELSDQRGNKLNYELLKSIIASQKRPPKNPIPSESFYIVSERVSPFIEPNFTKTEFSSEKPSILLVSAVGASGKTTTARVLSYDLKLPLLDLTKHKAVGDNTLSGLLMNAFPADILGRISDGLRTGSHGIIIDGIDEGRSKTTEQSFEAFLDDIVQRSEGSPSTTIVIFGRSQVLDSTWIYLSDSGASVGLARLEPFNMNQAKNYIDAQVSITDTSQQGNYKEARDRVLSKLGRVFLSHRADDRDTFCYLLVMRQSLTRLVRYCEKKETIIATGKVG